MSRARLTNRLVASLRPDPGGGTGEVQDDVLPGFMVRIFRSNRKGFDLYYRNADGQRRRPALDTHHDCTFTVEMAMKKAEATLANRRECRLGLIGRIRC